MGRLSVRNQILIAGALIVVIVIAVVVVVILPLITQAGEVDELIATEETNRMTAQTVVNRRQEKKSLSAVSEVELMRLANQVPDTPQLPSVIIELQNAANDAGLEFPQITTGAIGADEGGFSPITLSVNLEGSWIEMIEYLRLIDSLDRGTRVVTVVYNYVSGTEDEPGYVTAAINLEVYVMPAAATAPAGASSP
jgi:Tfp pilus assembly protein PilO